jgi:hypothetical protein
MKDENGIEIAEQPVAEQTQGDVVAPEVANTDTTTPVENIPAPTSRDKFHERIKSAYPDDTFEGDDAIYDKASSHLDGLEEFKGKGMEVNQKLITMLRGEPELEGIVKCVLKGMPTRAAIAKYFSPEDLIPAEGEGDFNDYQTSANDRVQRVADRDKFETEVTDNLAESEATLKAFAEEVGLDDNQSAELIDLVSEIMGDLYKGKLPKSLLAHVHKSTTADKQIEDAAADGELKGKNAKIEEKMTGVKKTGDKIPVFNGGKTDEIKEVAPVKISRLDALVEREQKKNKF